MKLFLITCVAIIVGLYFYFKPVEQESHETHIHARQQLIAAREMIRNNLLDDAWFILHQAGRNINIDKNELHDFQYKEGRELRVGILEEMNKILTTKRRDFQSVRSRQLSVINQRNNELTNLRRQISVERERARNSQIDINRNRRLRELESQERNLVQTINEMQRTYRNTTANSLDEQIQNIQKQIAIEKSHF